MKMLNIFAIVLVLIGGINWGLVGIFDFNLVDFVFGKLLIDRIIYVLVGLSAVYLILNGQLLKADKKKKR